MEMAEGLLFRHQLNVIITRVLYQLANFGRRERSAFGANQRIGFTRERVLHIKGVQVEFEESKVANLALDLIDGGHGAATDVVRDRSPTHRRPIDNLHRGNKCVWAFAAN